jgi:hypothetical protein
VPPPDRRSAEREHQLAALVTVRALPDEEGHPVVGHLTLNEESLRLPDDPVQRLIFSGAAAGTSSFERLRLLDSLIS